MAEIIEWATVGAAAAGKPKGQIRYLNILDDCIHTVRFVGNPVKYFSYLVNGRFAICRDPASCPFRAKYKIDPYMRYAANLLDRDEPDPNQRLKIVDLNPSVLRSVAAWARGHKADPGGVNGCDFGIEAQGKGKQRRYMVMPLDVTPFSDEEKQYIKANIYDLLKLHRAVPEAEIEDRLLGPKR